MRVSLTALLAPLTLAACSSGGGAAASPTPAPAQAATEAAAADASPSRPWVARVAALGTSGTQLTGTVRLTPSDKPEEYKVSIDFRGAKLGNKVPWGIATGQCGEASAVEVGNRVQYRIIEASADGTARANSTLKLALSDNSTYHVNFYASPTERERIVSCGPLVTGS